VRQQAQGSAGPLEPDRPVRTGWCLALSSGW